METTTTIFIKYQGSTTLLIEKDKLIELLQNKDKFIVVKKKTTFTKEPWEKKSEPIITISRIAINKDYIVTVS